jgi:hypothetical protein
MFGLLRTAVRFFVIGVGVGVLFAPRPGEETRRAIREKLDSIVGSVVELADLPPVEVGESNGGSRRRSHTSERKKAAEPEGRAAS